jgi:hypothetical protein
MPYLDVGINLDDLLFALVFKLFQSIRLNSIPQVVHDLILIHFRKLYINQEFNILKVINLGVGSFNEIRAHEARLASLRVQR